MHEHSSLDFARIAQDLQIRKVQVESVVQLLDEGNTAPFIGRYRQERTGGLPEEAIRQIQARISFQRQLGQRKLTILQSIESQGKLTDALRQAILGADTGKRLDDLFLPYRPKKRTPAVAAREKGLDRPALALWHSDPAVSNLDELLQSLVNPEKDLKTVEEVRTGLQQILAEMMAEAAEIRAPVRMVLWETGKIVSTKNEKLPEGHGQEYKEYFQYSEPARVIPPHRILTLQRGERDGALKVKIEADLERIKQEAIHALAGLLAKVQGQETGTRDQRTEIREPESGVGGQQPGDRSQESESGNQSVEPLGQGSEAGPPDAQPMTSPPPEAALLPEAAPLAASLTPELKPMAAVEMEALAPGVDYHTPHAAFLRTVLNDALERSLLPSLEREVRKELNDEAEGHAAVVFAKTLRSWLLQPPLRSRRVLAIDPGFRTGCRVAALDENGQLLEQMTIYPLGGGPRKPRPALKAPESSPATLASASAPIAASPPAEAAVPAPAADAIAAVSAESTPPLPADEVPAAAAVKETTPPVEGAPALPSAQPTAGEPVPDRKAEAKAALLDLVQRHQLTVAAVGNRTGCREIEELLAELTAAHQLDLSYATVNEAGSGAYAVGAIGREEDPEADVALRCVIAIGRRLQDPLRELVKVEPFQLSSSHHPELTRRDLKEMLAGVFESCVNMVGVDVNTASASLLSQVSGLNPMTARAIVEHRRQTGPFTSRAQLLEVVGLAPDRFVQAAGFLHVHGPNPLDRSKVHPENYAVAEQILTELGYTTSVLEDVGAQDELRKKLQQVAIEETARRLNVGAPTVATVLDALTQFGRDPRDELPPPILKKSMLRLDDMQPGLELKGTVLNVVDFGAFVDVGLKDSGLVHISQIANRYIKSPHDVVAVNDVVTVWVLSVDRDRGRVSLTMIKPGTERKPGERRPGSEQSRRERPPRGRRFGGPAPEGAGEGQGAAPATGRGRSPRGRGGPGGRGPRRGPPPATTVPSGPTGAPTEAAASAPPPPPPPPRRPRRETPKPKLTQAAIEGKVPLRTFGELSALFAARKTPPAPAPEPPSSSGSALPETPPPSPPEATASEPAAEAHPPPPS